MSLVLAFASFTIRYPKMPISPGSLVGRMYYLCDSDKVVQEFSGTGADKTWKDERTGSSAKRYGFGCMTGESGRKRVGVFVVGDQKPG